MGCVKCGGACYCDIRIITLKGFQMGTIKAKGQIMKDLYVPTRLEIETNWQKSTAYGGRSLCSYIDWNTTNKLSCQWDKIWSTRTDDVSYIEGMFNSEPDYSDLAYLLRALSLNMLLDDNNIN